VILPPPNDVKCLGPATEFAKEQVNSEAAITLAEFYKTTGALIDGIRDQPQRDDIGDPNDGPKLDACDPPQRLRFAPEDGNCFERAITYLTVAERIDPDAERCLITVLTDQGPHTLPIENGEPVILDPRFRRNALRAAVFKATRPRNGSTRVSMTPIQAVDWIASLAAEPAEQFRNGAERVRNGHRVLRGVLAGRAIRVVELRDAVFVLALAEREAEAFGAPGRCIVATTARAIDRLDQDAARTSAPRAPRNAGIELRLGKIGIKPDLRVITALSRVGGRLGYQAGLAALRAKIATLGVTPFVLSKFERELNREGLSLGPLAVPPPMPGTLSSVTPTALAGQWLAKKI
jgi:hypothetical protein